MSYAKLILTVRDIPVGITKVPSVEGISNSIEKPSQSAVILDPSIKPLLSTLLIRSVSTRRYGINWYGAFVNCPLVPQGYTKTS
ncbi:MAG: hypothetical protein IPO94_18815 [Saprospiraceae bacterium]|nr:hypothetical protein [Saprospiraceae bacterium]